MHHRTSRAIGLALVVAALAACSNDTGTGKTLLSEPSALVIPTLGNAPTVKHRKLPPGWPGPKKVDLVQGVRLADGTCDYYKGINDPIPGYTVMFLEYDETTCKAVAAQMDWAAKIDSLTGRKRTPLSPTSLQSVGGPATDQIAQAVYDCSSAPKMRRAAYVNYQLWESDGSGNPTTLVWQMMNSSADSIANPLWTGGDAYCVAGLNDGGSGTSVSITGAGYISGWAHVTAADSAKWVYRNCAFFNCNNSHGSWTHLTKSCPGFTAQFAYTSAASPSELRVYSYPVGGSYVWEDASNPPGGIWDVCTSSDHHVVARENPVGGWI